MTQSPHCGDGVPSVLIIGIGNDIRNDDAVGLAVAARVTASLAPHQRNVVVKTLSAGGWQLLHEIEGFDRLIVIDAYFTAESTPGRVRLHRPEDALPVRDIDAASAHLLSIPDAIALSRQHGYYTPTLLGMVTVDIGENCLTFGTGLSNPVKAAVNGAAQTVLALLEE